MQHTSTHTHTTHTHTDTHKTHTHTHTHKPLPGLSVVVSLVDHLPGPQGSQLRTHVCFLYVYSAAVTVNECHHCTSILVFFQKKTHFSTFFPPRNIFCGNATDCCPVAGPFSCVSGSLEVKWAAYNWIYTNDIMAGTVGTPSLKVISFLFSMCLVLSKNTNINLHFSSFTSTF